MVGPRDLTDSATLGATNPHHIPGARPVTFLGAALSVSLIWRICYCATPVNKHTLNRRVIRA
jgi:hypothetical protein